ncbi:hypothetical protein [Helicobacter sp. MIT 14-3879]|uniref:hypothetical protein n=1 Tax=Helicobacter sp. MIT 14-3879 TaxID=2040649 RepID=UPI000E1F38E0|nr:hypothetical protein [Helicobacter sp. MIT 14-3879]RDU64191.1 hypothetical protein CQA44_04510 [Helicobacter sp. MIT 14-3879]
MQYYGISDTYFGMGYIANILNEKSNQAIALVNQLILLRSPIIGWGITHKSVTSLSKISILNPKSKF